MVLISPSTKVLVQSLLCVNLRIGPWVESRKRERKLICIKQPHLLLMGLGRQ